MSSTGKPMQTASLTVLALALGVGGVLLIVSRISAGSASTIRPTDPNVIVDPQSPNRGKGGSSSGGAVKPVSVELQPTRGAKTSAIEVKATGFEPGERVNVRVMTYQVAELTADVGGSVAATIHIAESTVCPQSQCTVVVQGEQSLRWSNATYDETTSPGGPNGPPKSSVLSVELQPGRGAKTAPIVVKASGFEPGERVSIRASTAELNQATADAAGSVIHTIRIPDGLLCPQSQCPITVQGERSLRSARAMYNEVGR
jgi:hypothetical protein